MVENLCITYRCGLQLELRAAIWTHCAKDNSFVGIEPLIEIFQVGEI
jgi:hypothetical protein